MRAAAAWGGWGAAGAIAAIAGMVHRLLGTRMEAVARAGHELRGPITAARLGLAYGERSGELSPACLRAIDTELGRATLALEDLAGIGRGGARRRAPEKVDLVELIADLVRAAQGGADAVGARVATAWDGPGAAVWGDRLRLAQALGNLIANAIEHGGGSVGVLGSLRDGVIRVEVSDAGPGLPAPVGELIARPRRGRGTRGRGLAIAAAIADAHAGRIAAPPTPRGGLVVLELPASRHP